MRATQYCLAGRRLESPALDGSLSFKTHVENTKAKVCARNNIISKLTGTLFDVLSWCALHEQATTPMW